MQLDRDGAGTGILGDLAPGLEVFARCCPGGSYVSRPPAKHAGPLPCCRNGLLPRGTSWGAQGTPGVRLCQNEAKPPLYKGATPWASSLFTQEGAWPCLTLAGTWGSGRPASRGAFRSQGQGSRPGVRKLAPATGGSCAPRVPPATGHRVKEGA